MLDPAADKTIMICGYLFYTLRDGLPMVRIPAWLTFTVFIPGLLWLAAVLFRIAAVATLLSGWDYMRRAERMLDPLPGGT